MDEHMRYVTVLGVLCTVAVLGMACQLHHNEEIEAIQSYLSIKYDDFTPGPGGQVNLFGLSYLPASSELRPVQNATLAKYLPTTHFYQTTLATQYYEYMRVETLVSISRKGKGWDIRACLSPVFVDEACAKFLDQFRSVRIDTLDGQGLVSAIAILLATITSEGRIGAVTSSAWQNNNDDEPCRQVQVPERRRRSALC